MLFLHRPENYDHPPKLNDLPLLLHNFSIETENEIDAGGPRFRNRDFARKRISLPQSTSSIFFSIPYFSFPVLHSCEILFLAALHSSIHIAKSSGIPPAPSLNLAISRVIVSNFFHSQRAKLMEMHC